MKEFMGWGLGTVTAQDVAVRRPFLSAQQAPPRAQMRNGFYLQERIYWTSIYDHTVACSPSPLSARALMARL